MSERYRQKNIETHVVKIFRAVEGDRGLELAVVQFIVDGNATAPQLVNREVYVDRLDRRRKYGKTKGLRWLDWKFLTETPERIKEVAALLLDAPKGWGRRDTAKAAAADTQDDEGSF